MQNPFGPDELEFLEQGADTDDTKWTWPDTDKKEWGKADSRYQKFYEFWHNKPDDSDFLNTFPYKLSLGTNPRGAPLLGHRTKGAHILVTKSYDDMFHRLLRLRKNDSGRNQGAVITGQPGIGKTVFLAFMLARLISAHQVVLLYDNYDAILFFRGQVYSRHGASGFWNLPTCQQKPYCPIWALIDMDFRLDEPPVSCSWDYWPIQASPPDPIRWKSWAKRNHPFKLGMSPWTLEELMEGLHLSPEYDTFRRKLQQALPLLNGPMPPAVGDKAIDELLKVLHAKWNRNGLGASTTGQDENLADEAGQPLAQVDKVDMALEVLMHNITEEFGFAPRDVYNSIFRLGCERRRHGNVLRFFEHSDLRALVDTFYWRCELDHVSERVVVVYPHQNSDGRRDDRWSIDFKSVQIGRKVMESVRLMGDEDLLEMYNYLHGSQISVPLARWVSR